MVDKNRTKDKLERMDEVVNRDQYGWLNKEGFLKEYNEVDR